MIRLELRFNGSVQGVGFRATARSIAKHHDVVGWVRNEPDGTVRMVIESTAAEADAFLGALRSALEGRITRIESEELLPTGEFDRFEIRR